MPESLAPVLERALEECERQLARKGSPTKGGLQQLQGLIRTACGAGTNGGSSLCEVEARSDALQQQLDGVMADLDAAVVNSDPAGLAVMFDDLLVLCHKINNPLTSVLGRAQILQLKLGSDSESWITKPVQVIEESAKRVAGLVQELANVLCIGRKVFVDKTLPRYDSIASGESRESR